MVRPDQPPGPGAGRRQERVPRRDGREPVVAGRAGARRVRHHGRRVPALHRRDRPGRADQLGPRRPRHGRRTAAGRGRAVDPRGRGRPAVPARPGGGHPLGLREAVVGRRGALLRRPFVGDGGGPARRLVRRAAGDVPERARHRRGPARDPRGVRLPLQRPGDRLPRAPRLRPRRRGAVRGRPADGAFRRRGLRRDVHDGHRVGVHRRGLRRPRPTVSERRSCRVR